MQCQANVYSKKNIILLLKKYEIRPKKNLGQNFLVNKQAINKIISAANIDKEDIVVEIGPGIGALTADLAKNAKKVIAIEKDKRLIFVLNKTLKSFDNINLIEGDILKTNLTSLVSQKYKIVANIPFYLTGAFFRKIFQIKNLPALIVLTLQKEVAKRICAKPPQLNLLALSIQFYSKIEIVDYISKESFWPLPKVDSAIVKITPFKKTGGAKDILSQNFFTLIKAGFSQPRKQLVNNLCKVLKFNKDQIKLWLSKNGIDPKKRAGSLTLENWMSLAKTENILEKN